MIKNFTSLDMYRRVIFSSNVRDEKEGGGGGGFTVLVYEKMAIYLHREPRHIANSRHFVILHALIAYSMR